MGVALYGKGAPPLQGRSPFDTKGRNVSLVSYFTTTSTRRFFARPAAVLLLAIGSLSP